MLSPVYFVCSQGASSMHRKPSVTLVPFSFLIRNYWVVSLTQCWISTPKRTSLLLSVGKDTVPDHTSLINQCLSRPRFCLIVPSTLTFPSSVSQFYSNNKCLFVLHFYYLNRQYIHLYSLTDVLDNQRNPSQSMKYLSGDTPEFYQKLKNQVLICPVY